MTIRISTSWLESPYYLYYVILSSKVNLQVFSSSQLFLEDVVDFHSLELEPFLSNKIVNKDKPHFKRLKWARR